MSVMLKEYGRRPQRAWQADGLVDMAIGLVLFCLALIFLNGIYMVRFMQAQQGAPSGYFLVSQINTLITCVLQLLVVVPFFLVEPLKSRFVYPRSGYMQLRTVPRERRLFPVVAVSIAVFFGFFGLACAMAQGTPVFLDATNLTRFWTADKGLVALGIGFGTLLVVNYLKFGFVRHLVIAMIGIAAVLTLAATPFDMLHKLLLLSLVAGVSFLLAGSVAFVRLLRTPLAQDEEREPEAP